MSIPQSDNATKSVRVPEDAWEAASLEAVYRRTSIVNLFGLAWKMFAALPEAKREKMVRDLESNKEVAA